MAYTDHAWSWFWTHINEIASVLIILAALVAGIRWAVEESRKPKLVIESPFLARLGPFKMPTKVEKNPNGVVEISSTLYLIIQNSHKKPAEKCRVEATSEAALLSDISRLTWIRRDGSRELESDIGWKDERRVELFTLKGSLNPSNVVEFSLEYKVFRFEEGLSSQRFATISKPIDSSKSTVRIPENLPIPAQTISLDPKGMLTVINAGLTIRVVAEGGYQKTENYSLLCFVRDPEYVRNDPEGAIGIFLFNRDSL